MRWIASVFAAAWLLWLTGCGAAPGPSPPARPSLPLDRVAPPVQSIQAEPMIRVRIGVQRPRVELAGGTLVVGPGPADRAMSRPRQFASPVTISRASGAFLITDAGGMTMRWALPSLSVVSGQLIAVNGQAYPGRLVILPSKHDGSKLDVINHVGIETYLPGVLERELYASWHPAAYRAQAIAARSYALVQIARRRDELYDLEATQASQVYGGRATRPRAVDAVERTRGMALTYQGRVVEAFYSSSSGGYTQDAKVAFVDRAGWFDIPPLKGRPHNWGRSAKLYQWGPITRDASTLARRIAAWGRDNQHPVAALAGLRDVRIAERSSSGRPAQFDLVDSYGRRFTLGCEQFRFAANHDAPGLQPLLAEDQLRSSNFTVRMSGRSVQFVGGRGYGHGVGLDQWAAQEMAQQGYGEADILRTFYPRAELRKLY